MFLYDINETMHLLGNQRPFLIIGVGATAEKDFKAVVRAHEANKTTSCYDICNDAFMLGYIYGKRAERARRKSMNNDKN